MNRWSSIKTIALPTHAFATKTGALVDIFIVNKILNGYVRAKDLTQAHQLFDETPHRDTVTWNTLVTGYVYIGHYERAVEVMKMMKRGGFDFDQYTFGSILKGVASMGCVKLGEQVHSSIVKTGYQGNVYSESALLDMYAKCNRMQEAYAVFECMPERNCVSWNALIAGYAQMGDIDGAFFLFDSMERENMMPDDATFASLLTLLNDPELLKVTTQIHAKIIKYGRAFDTTIINATITAYSECGDIKDSQRVFGDVEGFRDLVTWNSMLAAYVMHDKGGLAFEIFVDMQKRGIEQDMYTYTSVVSACYGSICQNQGKSLHALVIKRGLDHIVPICNSLIAMYIKFNHKYLGDAMKLFNSMEFKDSVSWNSILTGFSQSGLSEEALKFFGHMRSMWDRIDHYAFSAVLRSCSDLAIFQLGQQVHVLVVKSGFLLNEFVASSLMFMYSKCGVMEDARRSFEETPKNSPITWNSIIFGYAQHGQGKAALGYFSLMQESGVRPDHITLVAVLTACSHIGLVEKGSNFLRHMEVDYGIQPRMEHFACGVDLLGRAGYINEAKSLIETMPFKPDAMVLKTLLGACRLHGKIELASEIARLLLVLEPEEHCTYILLSDMYGHLGKWDERASVKKLMRKRGVKKVPGWSWIEVKNEVHAFNAEDRTHPQCESIYQTLTELMEEIGFSARSDFVDSVAYDLVYIEGICTY
ncbi:hypothetical protein GIB67_012796 [Kingdonia uniflora]|uniref:Chlororespiratory reduction 21 n=1 Tax=Kingdonia uniflora TaxID=39325 RepID=A0A7J7NF85_9MAGN|nr:hypothetical protein GIB67_012796 [Kingdonia uniflora]